ncbi:MAG: hypothetical protein J0G29_00925 [Alphaproteobacteria bacterium]|nr:hypothetical protein [Alphaproteobacteria bacterium]
MPEAKGGALWAECVRPFYYLASDLVPDQQLTFLGYSSLHGARRNCEKQYDIT